jgi:hypothetical protein
MFDCCNHAELLLLGYCNIVTTSGSFFVQELIDDTELLLEDRELDIDLQVRKRTPREANR